MSEIPPIFHSLEHDEPFKVCLTCDREFSEMDDPYTASKVFRGPECVFEYAMCLPCRRSLAEEFSEESRDRINDFFEKNQDLADRSERLSESRDHKEWIGECATCRTPLNEVRDYSIACMGFGVDMVYDPFPMMICSKCEQKVQSKLSKSTRDSWDRFITENFDGPPAESLKPDGVPVLV